MDFTVDHLQDLFFLFVNDGRADKVVLGLTDTMYKKRLSTAGSLTSLTKGGFRNFIKSCPGLADGMTIDLDFVFMQHLGFTDPKKPKFELNFEQFLDALAAVATHKYAMMDAETAVKTTLKRHVRPLYIAKFGEPDSPVKEIDDVGSVRPVRSPSKRMSRVVLTTEGMAPSSSVGPGPRTTVVVDQSSDRTVAESQSTPLGRRMSVRMFPSPDQSPAQDLRQTQEPFSDEARASSGTPPHATRAPSLSKMSTTDSEMVQVEDEFRRNVENLTRLQAEQASPQKPPPPPPARPAAQSAQGSSQGPLVSPTPAPDAAAEARIQEMRAIIERLVATVDRLSTEMVDLRRENAELRSRHRTK